MRPSPALSAEARRILSLAWPVMLTSLNWTLLQATDIAMLGLVSTAEVAAYGASRALVFLTIVLALGMLTGVLVFAARADGARDMPATGRIFQQGLALGALLGLAACALLFAFALPLLRGIGVSDALAPPAAAVIRVIAFTYPFQLVIVAASYFLEGVSRPRRVMAVNLATLPLNALLTWLWSGGHWGFPALGAVGAAAGTLVASVAGAAGMLAMVWTLPDAAARGVRDWRGFVSRETAAGARRLLVFGTMPAIASALEITGFSILIALSTRIGDVATHAFQIVFSIHNLTFALALGFGSAAGVRVGNAVGEGRPEAAAGRTLIAAALSALATGVSALLLILASGPVVGVFPAAPGVHALAAGMLIVWAPFILFDGVQVVLVYALRSLGDQVVAGVIGILAFFVTTGGLGVALAAAGWGTLGLVLASGAGMVVAALLYAARLAQVSRRARLRS